MGFASRRKQDHTREAGVFLVTAALVLLFLLGFMGLALDFGRLFIVKSELQTAMDSCALAAAKELNGEPHAVQRARLAGLAAGNLNRVNFQSQPAGLVAGDIQFSDRLAGAYSAEPVGPVRYVRCERSVTGLAPLLLHAMDAFASTSVGGAQSVRATAVATLVPSQTHCVVPVGVCQRSEPFVRGQWLAGVTNENDDMPAGGQFRWLDLSGQGGGTQEIKDILRGSGQCGFAEGATVRIAQSGKKVGAVEAWNARFGVFKDPAAESLLTPPDTTGFAWYVDGTSVPESLTHRFGDTAAGYRYHQGLNSPYQGLKDLNKVLSGGMKTSSKDIHAKGSADSRVITTAVINCDAPSGAEIAVQGYACMFMLHPLQQTGRGGSTRMWLEYISDATATSNNPCASYGLPGGSAGLRVPGLVQ